ncbi:MAG TPA: type II secretion system F family protein [Rhodanobacteraceae bacterium]
MNLYGIALLVFLCVAIAGYVAAFASHVFWHRYQDAFTQQARFNLADMFMFMDPRRLFVANIIGLVVVPLVVWGLFDNPVLAVGVLLVLLFVPRKVYAWMRQRRIDRIQNQLPDGLMMMASGMRAGLGLTPALESLAHDIDPPLSQELALVLRQQRMGVKLDDALEEMCRRVPVQDMALVASAIHVSREVGGNLAETLATLSETLRRRLVMENKVKSLTAQGRLQGIVMALLPVALVLALTAMYPDTMQALYHTALGWAVIAVGCVMEFLGYRMCRKIMAIDI